MILKPIHVKIDDLIIDPNNPRFVHHADKEIDESMFADPKIQADAFSNMVKHFDVDVIEASIKTDGWIDADRVFVRLHKKSKKYLVIEGNRRVTAIKSLLTKHASGAKGAQLEKERLDGLQEIECIDLSSASKEEVEKILGLRHHGAIKQWAPLPAAKNIYSSYIGKLGQEIYMFEEKVSKKVAQLFSLSPSHVKDRLNAYCAYLQIYDAVEDPATRDRLDEGEIFSIIFDAVKNPSLKSYYEFVPKTGRFSEEGLEKFMDQLVELQDRLPIVAQASAGDANLRDFIWVYRESQKDFEEMIEARKKPSDVRATIQSLSVDNGIEKRFERIEHELKKVTVKDLEAGVPSTIREVIDHLEETIKAIRKLY